MIEYKLLTSARVPVRLMTGSFPVAGAVYTDITASVRWLGNASGWNLTIPHGAVAGTNTTWAEITAPTRFASSGYYELYLTSSDFAVTGAMVVYVDHPSSDPFFAVVKVVSNEEVDTYTAVAAFSSSATDRSNTIITNVAALSSSVIDRENTIISRIGTPVGVTLSADIVELSASNLTRHATTQTNITALSSSVIDRENTIISRIGTPAGASLSADVVELSASNLTRHATTQTNIAALSSSAIDRSNTIISRIGTPAGASVSADIVELSSSNIARHATTQTNVAALSSSAIDRENTIISRIGTPAGASVSADLVLLSSSNITRHATTQTTLGTPQSGSVSADIAAVRQDSYKLVNYQEGRWKVHLSGSDAGRLVLYNVDGSTALRKFTIYDVTGSNNPLAATFERIPV